jgi:hypothetical protein
MMAHVLVVAAIQLGHPVVFIVFLKSCNPALQLSANPLSSTSVAASAYHFLSPMAVHHIE